MDEPEKIEKCHHQYHTDGCEACEYLKEKVDQVKEPLIEYLKGHQDAIIAFVLNKKKGVIVAIAGEGEDVLDALVSGFKQDEEAFNIVTAAINEVMAEKIRESGIPEKAKALFEKIKKETDAAYRKTSPFFDGNNSKGTA